MHIQGDFKKSEGTAVDYQGDIVQKKFALRCYY
jgi:hypothetical protein